MESVTVENEVEAEKQGFKTKWNIEIAYFE